MLVWTLLSIAFAAGLVRVFWGHPRPTRRCAVLMPGEVAFLTGAAEATFPAGGAIPASGADAEVAAFTDRWLALLHPRMRLLMRLLFFLIEHSTLLLPAPGSGGWRRFSSLRAEQQLAVLDGWRTSRFYARRLVWMSLRAILTMGYLGHPPILRELGLAPRRIQAPVCEADLLYPPIGRGPDAIRHGSGDLTPPSDGSPLELQGALDPRYAEPAS
jgi:hypothetical protein